MSVIDREYTKQGQSMGSETSCMDSGALCLHFLLSYHGLRSSPQQLLHDFSGVDGRMDVISIVRAARKSSLKAKAISSSLTKLKKLPLPAIAEFKNGDFVIVAKVSNDNILIQRGATPPQKLSLQAFEEEWAGQTVARVRELDSIREFLTSSALTVVIDLFFTIIFFAVMWMFSPTLTWIVLASIPLYALLSLAITPELRRRVEDRFYRGATNQAFLVESISGAETLKSMAVEPQMRARWDENLAAFVKSSFKTIVLGAVGSQVDFLYTPALAI